MTNIIRTDVNVVLCPMAIVARVLCIVTLALGIAAFGRIDGLDASAHEESEAAKPADQTPLPEPLPPRPTEYPKGLGQRPPPGSPAAAKPTPAKPEPAAHADKPAASGEHTGLQEMPAAIPGTKPGAPPNGAASGAKPDDGTAAKPVLWTPPKRYHFVTDTYTGLALGGTDPVAYFVDGQSRSGLSEHELDWGGATWHFLNEGNLLAFKQNPEVYAPRFGGRCAFALSQGLLVEGQPQFFVIHRDRLYVFANAGNRVAFLMNPDAFVPEAEREWPILTRSEP